MLFSHADFDRHVLNLDDAFFSDVKVVSLIKVDVLGDEFDKIFHVEGTELVAIVNTHWSESRLDHENHEGEQVARENNQLSHHPFHHGASELLHML